VLLLRLLEFCFVVLFLALLLTQVVVPARKGTRLFPLLDRRRRDAFDALAKARDEVEVAEVEKAADIARHAPEKNDHV